MKITGIICEYNPFHAMHSAHIRLAREKTQADYIVCALSGPFVQRGDLAICDKWRRTKMALLGGADAVFELPVRFALGAAPDFARGGVTLLSALGADALCFGSENDDLALLEQAARLQIDPTQGLKDGKSYPRALGEAAGALSPWLSLPNFTLGVEYLRAIAAYAPHLQAAAVLRTGAHHAKTLDAFASAGAIRAGLFADETQRRQALAILPDFSAALLPAKPLCLDDLNQAVLYALRTMTPERMSAISGMREGLENRIFQAAQVSRTLEELFANVKCKRYTMAAIRRAVCAAALGMTKELEKQTPTAPYARLLGFRTGSAALLKQIKQRAQIPILTKIADAPPNDCLLLDMRAQDLADLAACQPIRRDLTTSPVRV